jgi:hypothetical protein
VKELSGFQKLTLRCLRGSAVAGFCLASTFAIASGAPARDEAKASRYLHCAVVNRYWVEGLRENDPNSSQLPLRQDASDRFWQAAGLVSDLDFVKSHLAAEVDKVKELAGSMEKDNGEGFRREDLSCAKTFQDEVVPLFQHLESTPLDTHKE